MRLMEMKQERAAALDAADSIIAVAERGNRDFSDAEKSLIEGHTAKARELNAKIQASEARNTLLGKVGPHGFFGRGGEKSFALTDPGEAPEATAFRHQFGEFVTHALQLVEGAPAVTATAPSGPISVGTTSGWESVGLTIPTEILPHLASYFALDSFGAAGSTTLFTDHTRPLFQPVLSAGAADSVFAENAAPGTSQPFGLSGFTFGGSKYSRLVLASYESLMNSEVPLQAAILDELLTSLASTLTAATTVQMNAALTAASSTLEVGTGGSNDIYSSLVNLRGAVPPRFDLPTNKWMLSRATLSMIRNKRASTSGVPMFDPETNQLFGKQLVINDNFDAVCGAGFVVFGDWAGGCYLRRTPVQTRVFQELYAQSGQLGFRTTQWADSHYLAELAGAAQPPSAQPLYYTSLVGES